MNDDIFGHGVIHGAVGGALPGGPRRLKVGKNANDVELLEVLEIKAARILDPAAEHQVKKRFFMRHGKFRTIL